MTIKLNGSTAGSVALDAPASTTGNADISFKLPIADGTAGQVLTTDGSGNLSWVTLPTPGITMVDEWRTYNTQSVPGNTARTVSSWERNDNTFSQIGSGMTESNGLFTFPQTGIYFILGNFSFFDTSGDNRYITPRAYWNNTYITQVYTSLKYVSGETFSSVSTPFILDVTSTSPTLHFSVVSENDFQITGNNWAGVGNENVNTCSVTFIRLGDT